MSDLKNELSNLIENNKIDKAIKLLKEESAKSGGKLDHIIISLSSRYKRYKEKSLMGLESREQEFTKIVSDALELVKVIDDPSKIVDSDIATPTKNMTTPTYTPPPSSSSTNSSKYIQMGIGALAVIGIIALISMFAGGGGEDPGSEELGYSETYLEPDNNGDQMTVNEGSQNTSYKEPTSFEEPVNNGGQMSDNEGGQNTTYEEPTSYEEPTTYEEPATEPDAGAGENTDAYPLYDISGNWRQIAQSFGPENDCPDCTIEITQNGSVITVIGNGGMSAQLEFISEYGLFEGLLDWGDISPDDPEQAVQVYFEENGALVVNTMIQGVEYLMYFAEN